MYENKKILALIPARGGSKRLPRKNIRLLLGKPLIGWTVEQAKISTYIDRVIVSTDDKEIALVAKECGAEVPFLRPKELAADNSKSISLVLHAMDWVENNNENFDILILLQPTSPLRLVKDIDRSIELLFSKKADAIVSVCHTENCIDIESKALLVGLFKDSMSPLFAEHDKEGISNAYKLNGAIYLAYWDFLKRHKTFYGKKTLGYLMPRIRSVDIDTRIDFASAESLLSGQNNLTEDMNVQKE